MLTQTVTITQNSNPNIIIGRRSTYETQQVIFDVSWLVQTYGEGTAELLIKRPKDASAYPVVATLDGNTLTWTVSETDTQYRGHGECEIFWYVNGGLAKSCICGITILRDIGDTTETAPDPYETWVETLSRLGAETLTNAQAAEQSANNAAQSASEADNSAAAALESEENALNSENAAKASEQAAAASKQGAEQSATEAAQSANAAESSANDAQESADNASASADRAEQAAASIEGDTERAEAAAREAQGAASYASVFADTASAKATEAAGSAATAEQAASTATQEAADASASATAAVDSASSAYASATAAGNAQSAAETARGKAEDAQEAAETAAQSIEDSAAQIDQNAEDILNLKSALNTKAGIIRDTASGAVASFAPDSTIPNLLGVSVDIEPVQAGSGDPSPDNVRPISGRESVEVEAAGKNLLDMSTLIEWDNRFGLTLVKNSDGSFTLSGTATGTNYQAIPVYLKAGNYILSGCPSGGSNNTYSIFISQGINKYDTGNGVAFTVLTDGVYNVILPRVMSGTVCNNLVFKPMIRPASISDAAFEPFAGTTYTIQLGDTVYGGTLDVTNGTLTVDMAMVDLGTLRWRYFDSLGIWVSYSVNGFKPFGFCCCSQYVKSDRNAVDMSICLGGTGWFIDGVPIRDSRYTDTSQSAELKAALSGVMLCYELATPTPISTTPIEISTVEGQNNVFSPDGDVTVEYAADLKTYIDSKIAAAVAALS